MYICIYVCKFISVDVHTYIGRSGEECQNGAQGRRHFHRKLGRGPLASLNDFSLMCTAL